MATITLQPASESDTERLNELATKQKKVYRSLNKQRWKSFNSRNKIFEKTTDDIPETDLPTSTEEILLEANAQDWETHIYHAVKTAHIARMKSSDIISADDIWFDKTTLANPIGVFPELCITTDSISITDNTLQIHTKQNQLKFTITDTDGDIETHTDDVLYLYETSEGYALEPYDFCQQQEHAIPLEDKTQTIDHQAVLRTLSVAASVTAVAQVEPQPDNPAFPDIFNEIGVYWESIETNTSQLDTYLVGTHERGKDRIKDFLNTTKTERTLHDYCNLLGYPTELSEYYKNHNTENYDRYSSEEFALYALLSGDISDEDTKYILHTPYRPPPNKEAARRAIQLAKQFKAGLTIMQNEAPTQSDSDTIKHQYEAYYSQYNRKRRKPFLEVYTPLVNTPTQPNQPTKNQTN